MNITLGIDPGWASCGWSLIEDGKVLASTNLVPRDHVKETEVVHGAVEMLVRDLSWHLATKTETGNLCNIKNVYIERYVAYKGIHSDTSESILMFIGAVIGRLEMEGCHVHPVRAIDWKPAVCKYLVRTKGFNNPHPSFDKKFSLLAAKELSGLTLKTDHEADAICLSYLGEIEAYNKERKAKK